MTQLIRDNLGTLYGMQVFVTPEYKVHRFEISPSVPMTTQGRKYLQDWVDELLGVDYASTLELGQCVVLGNRVLMSRETYESTRAIVKGGKSCSSP